LLGERVWDISRSIDVLAHFEEIDIEKIGIMGNSGGGTASYYAACTDERIKIAMPSCAVCSFGKSIGIMRHCDCNYLPHIAKYFDMGELACLIAPRPLIIVAGREDHGFLFDGVKSVYSVIEKIYKKAGGECQLVVGSGGHRFYAKDSWKVFKKMAKWQK